MRELFLQFFDKNLGGQEIAFMNPWHIAYIVMILGAAIVLAITLKDKSEKTKRTILSVYLIASVASYCLDYVFMAFAHNEIDIDKLPFHICTSMGIIAAFGFFNQKMKWLKQPSAVLALVATLMYITYPGSAIGDISPFCYKVVQTFFYHGALFTFGFLALAWGEVRLDIKKVWKEALLLVFIVVWATIGNTMFNDGTRHYDWFFLTGSTFSFLPPIVVFFAVPVVFFCMVLLIYGIYFWVKSIIEKKAAK